jgi:hypothetical protein
MVLFFLSHVVVVGVVVVVAAAAALVVVVVVGSAVVCHTALSPCRFLLASLHAARCTSASAFVQQLQALLSVDAGASGLVVVLDHAEHLLDLPPSALALMLQLGELCARNVCAVLVSRLSWTQFRAVSTALIEPLLVHFAPYSREQTCAILMLLLAPTDPEVYEAFLNSVVLSQPWSVCHDLDDLRYAGGFLKLSLLLLLLLLLLLFALMLLRLLLLCALVRGGSR